MNHSNHAQVIASPLSDDFLSAVDLATRTQLTRTPYENGRLASFHASELIRELFSTAGPFASTCEIFAKEYAMNAKARQHQKCRPPGSESLHTLSRTRLTCAENPSTSIASQVSRSFNLVTDLQPAAKAQIQKEGQP